MTLNEATKKLVEVGIDSAREDARAIFSHFSRLPSCALISGEAECEAPELKEAVLRRAKREPLQYIIGEVGFYRESYRVTPDCLIPRADTEILVDFAVKNLPRDAHFLDLCTGSGCVAISTLKNREDTDAIALDLSERALEIARENAERNSVKERISFVQADVLAGRLDGEFSAVLSNPPYVKNDVYESLAPEIYFEPRLAFVGGEDGCDFYRTITAFYRNSIKSDGFIAFEIGFDQAEILCEIADKNGMKCEIIKDLSGLDRVAVLRKN